MAEKIVRPILTYADEAHRLEERSQYTKKTGNENQVKETIHASACSVFSLMKVSG